ncbi:MAG: 50S ribosomal protein L11 methyltransferase [Chloroflexaceae bacterium]
MATMNWLELWVEVDSEAVEAVAEVLAGYGYNGGVVVEPAWTPGDEGPEFRYDPARPSVLRTYVPLDERAEDTRQRVEQALWHLGQMRPIGPLQARALQEEDWANAWKQHYAVLRVGERIVIVPSWLEHHPAPEDVVLHLDPGMAFGTGLHPTTRLCLRLLERHARPGQRVLDLGTGSGILAIAAARMGADVVLALDNDPVAVAVAAENVARNGVSERVTVAEGSLGAGARMGHWLSGDFGPPEAPTPDAAPPRPGPFNLIVANLIARVLVILATDLAAALAPGATLISSGILDTRAAEVEAAFAAAGLRLIERHTEDEWVALVHTPMA